ncbi:MAG: ferrous iron transport protein B [Deltaproteobacteria bacterium]|nr:ferrous iron transport protein B [Deltaproteobacteria bacterium]
MEQKITVALAGNPNAGKTTIFNALTGARQHVGNWPGVTVEKKEGTVKYNSRDIHIVDLPGTYSLTAFSLEEIIARNFIVDSAPDLVVNVVDASNLERNLYLSVQLMEMGCKLVLALNMIDVARGRGITIDEPLFTNLMGVPVILMNGKKGIGLDDLIKAIISEVDKPRPSDDQNRLTYGSEVEEELCKIDCILSQSFRSPGVANSRWLSVKLLEGDTEIIKKIDSLEQRAKIIEQVDKSRAHLNNIFGDSPEIVLADARYGFISGAIKQTVQIERTNRVNLSESIDKILTNRLLGPLILLLVLYSVYIFTFNGSAPLVQYFDSFFSWSGDMISSILPEGLLKSLVVSGIIKGVGGVLGFTPLIAFMFFAIAILEDTGYMARIAFMLDRVLRGFGLHGASMLALMVAGGIAGGCAVPGIMATRTMKEPKERLVTILVAPLMNCGAKLPVYALLIGAFFPGNRAAIMFLLTLISWIMVLLAGRVIRSTVLSGPSAPFVLELPPYRVPTFQGLFIHTWERTWMYLKKAGTVILAVSIIIWALMTFPGLSPERKAFFEEKQDKLSSSFLKDPAVSLILKNQQDLKSFEDSQSVEGKDTQQIDTPLALRYAQYKEDKLRLENEEKSEKLRGTIAGRVGAGLVWVFKPIGFDWKTNVALLGGFAAKEVVVSTLGTAYSMGSVEREQYPTLSEQLKHQPGWNPLMAFTLIMFVMLYAPCVVTLVVIKRETGKWRWMLFAMVYTTVLAYVVAFIVKTTGTLLGIGLT